MRPFFAATCAAVVSLAFALPASADNSGAVRGSVSEAGKAVAGATITLRSPQGAPLTTKSDAQGRFAFPRVPYGRYLLSASGAGAEADQDVDVATDAIIDLDLHLRPLKEIGKTGTTVTRGPAGDPVAVNTLTQAQIAAMPDNQSLNSLIETMPGIVKFSYNEPVAHGFHGLQYEIDGVPLPFATTSNFSEVLDPRTIDSLEVFTGAFPAEYGGARMGAVVNITSKRATDLNAGEQGSLTIGGGSYANAQASLTEAVTEGTTRIFFTANEERNSRGLDSPTEIPEHDNTNQSNQFLRTITNIGAHDSLAFDGSNNYAAFQIPINTTPNDPNSPVVSVPGTDDVQREYDSFFNLTYTHNTADGNGYAQISPWYRYDRVVYDGDLEKDVMSSQGTGLEQDRRSAFEGLRLVDFHTYGANSVKAGVDGSIENFNGNTLIACAPTAGCVDEYNYSAQAQRGTQTDAYIEDKWTPTRYLSMQAGMRYDHSTGYVSGSQLSPRFEVDAAMDPVDIFHFYYGRLYAAPFLEDTREDAVLTAGAADTTPVYDLKPEHDSYYEFGLAHQLAPNARSYLNFWKRDVTNVLDTTQLASTPIFAVYNNTIGIAKGVEGRVDARFNNGDSMFFSAALSQSLAGGISGSTFLFCPPPVTPGCLSGIADVTLQPEDHDQTFASTLDYTHRFGTRNEYFASLEPQYGTGYPVQFQNGSGRLLPHLIFNASVGRNSVKKGQLGFNLSMTNLTNDQYLIKVNNGFNTTQYFAGRAITLRLTEPF
jgi:outer membrane receptor protein involved in Fe transport